MVGAVGQQLARHVAPVWGAVPALEFVPSDGSPSMLDAALCYIDDYSDIEGALGYHYEADDGTPTLRVFAAEILDGGGAVLTSASAVSVTLSHEVLEVVGDAAANRWADGPGGRAYAVELADAVQGDAYDVDGVAVSNFVLPAFFSPRAGAGTRFDFLGRLSAPFTMTPGGYQITRGTPTDDDTVWGAGDAFTEVVLPGMSLSCGPDVPERKRLGLLAKYRGAQTGRRPR